MTLIAVHSGSGMSMAMGDHHITTECLIRLKADNLFSYLPNFVIHKNFFAFLDGLDRYNENFIINDKISCVAQLPVVGIDNNDKPAQKMILNKPFHRFFGIWS